MGIQDFGAIFDVLDPACRGYLTTVQIQQFHESLHFTPIDIDHVTAAIGHVSGRHVDGLVTKDKFVQVLQELDRRRQVEEQARWDFRALDRTGSYLISVNDALLLFRNTHGPHFSMSIWQRFLASRHDARTEVSFDEVRMWLCDIPEEAPTEEVELRREEERLQQLEQQQAEEEYNTIKRAKEDGANVWEKEEYENKTRRGARRKLNRWDKEGIESLLYDDGVDRGEEVPERTKATVGINDLLDALDMKYDILRKKVFWEMVEKQAGDLKLGDTDHVDAVRQLQLHERHMRRSGTLASSADTLQGATVSHELKLPGCMGEVGKKLIEQQEKFNKKRMQLHGEGRPEDEIEKTLRHEHELAMKGPVSSADLLVALSERWHTEKDDLLGRLRGNHQSRSTVGQLTVEYCRLERQNLLVHDEEQFNTAATAAGLAERPQQAKQTRFETDRLYQEQLAGYRLRARKLHSSKVPVDTNKPRKGQSLMDLQLYVVREMTWKHVQEREILVEMLTGRDAGSAKTAGRQLTGPQRRHRLTTLRNQRLSWRDSSAEYRVSHGALHRNILQQGVGLYYEDIRHRVGGGDASVSAAVMADLQQHQDGEFEELLARLHAMAEAELEKLGVAENRARLEELLEGLAVVLLGVFEIGDEERPLVRAVEAKYDTLRHVLLQHALRAELGLAWDRLDVEEQQRRLVKKKNEEQKLRQDGRFDEMSQLITKLPPEWGSLRTLLGEDRAEFDHRVTIMAEKKDHAILQGLETVPLESDEAPADQFKSTNLLADLVERFYVEQDALVAMIRSPDNKVKGQAGRQLPLARVQLESRCAGREENFEVAALAVGLLERIMAVHTNRHHTDRARQLQLSVLRNDARRQRVEKGLRYQKELDEYARPEKGDHTAWITSFLHEQQKKHVEERELLLAVLQDPGLEELVEVAHTMQTGERSQRLSELRTKRNNLDLEEPNQQEENYSILEEAAAIQTVMKRESMAAEAGGRDVTQRDVTVTLLADLQDEQDREMAHSMGRIPDMTEADLKKSRSDEIHARHWRSAENVLAVLTRHQGVANDNDLLKALEEKYDALRDKLLMEALIRQHGEAEWARLGETERNKLLLQLRLKEKQLRRQGNHEEVARLLGENEQNEHALRTLMGDNRDEYERKLKDRLAQRQKRVEEGLDPVDEEEGSLEESSGGDQGSLLGDLQGRYEEEKEALLRRLKGLESDYLSERDRQTELLRLRRERRRAEEEDRFENAARLIGLAERHQGAITERLENDRLRQEQLAKDRLERLRARRGQKVECSEEVLQEGDRTQLQDAVMRQLEERHSQERALFVDLLSKSTEDDDLVLIVQGFSDQQRQDKLQELKEYRLAFGLESTSDNHEVLLEACVNKIESRRMTLSYGHDRQEVSNNEVHVSLLADLQTEQDRETEELLKVIVEKDESDLVTLQVNMVEERKQQRADTVAAVLFKPELSLGAENDLLTALDSKYDALRDKLLVEALIAQASEAEWARLSEGERQKRIARMKLEERRLRKQGKYDEAAALLGEAARNHESLQKLLGESREEQERQLRERLERRRQRRDKGMSEEECNKLEEEEIAQEEEEKKKRRNVLLDLQKNYDMERDALLRALRESEDRSAAERLRQLEIARLKREQRRAKTEEKYEAAALVLGLSKKQDERMEAERQRQEQLARERLAARQAARKAGVSQISDLEKEVSVPEDDKDVAGLQDAILKEVELKHQQEREKLLELLVTEVSGGVRETARSMTDQQREEKLEELRELRQLSREQGDPADQVELLKEGTGIRVQILADKLKADGENDSDESIQVALLANLQEEQDKEMRAVVNETTDMDAEALRKVKSVQSVARQHQWYDNLVTSVLGPSEDGEDSNLGDEEKELVRALGKKYDAARDKLLIEALMKQAGEVEWAALTEKQRQQRLVKLRLEERRLRRDGKYDEAAQLLGNFRHDEQVLLKKLGDSRSEQKRKLEERLQRRAQLQAEREAQGLSTDDAILDAIQDQEGLAEGDVKKKNVLESLDQHYEDEKEALLASLRGQDQRLTTQRERQLELVKLRRQAKLMQREDRFDSAAILLNMAEQHEQKLEANYVMEKERQRELARERLAAHRRKIQEKGSVEEDPQDELASAVSASTVAKEGSMALQEAVLEEVGSKHSRERETLMDLFVTIETNTEIMERARKLEMEEARLKLEQFHLEHIRWQEESRRAVGADPQEGVSGAADRDRHSVLSGLKEPQLGVLTESLAVRIQMEVSIQQDGTGGSAGDLQENVKVALLADLQARQTAETAAIERVMVNQDDPMLIKLLESQHQARVNGWYDNLRSTVFRVPTPSSLEDLGDLPNKEVLEEELEKDLEKEKEEHLEKLRRAQPGGEVDTTEALRELERQQEAKRQALRDSLERQQQQVKNRLEARRLAREVAEYEEEAAVSLVRTAERQHSVILEKKEKEKGRQQDLMAQRLAARREARRQGEEAERLMSSTSDLMSDTSSRTNTPSLPGVRMRREKTAFDVELSESQKREVFSQVVKEHADWNRKISADQQRQQEQLQKRLRDRTSKRQEEADALFTLGLRQKTMLEKTKQEERDRQISLVKERVARVRHERTMTMMERGEKSAKKFDELVTDTDGVGLSEDEKMALVAQRMQEKFTQEQRLIGLRGSAIDETGEEAGEDNTDSAAGGGATKRRTNEDKMAIIKQRRHEKKRQRQLADQNES